MAKDIEPRIHTGGSRFKEAVGEGAGRGFRYGLLGAALGALVVPVVGVAAVAGAASLLPGITFLGTLSAMGIGGSLVLGALIGIVAAPFTAGSTAIGAGIGSLLGINNGAKDASHRVSKEHEAARFQQAYNQSKLQIENAMVAQMMGPQEAPVMAAANDNPYHQAASKIDAATVAHQQTVAAPNMEHARV